MTLTATHQSGMIDKINDKKKTPNNLKQPQEITTILIVVVICRY